MCNLLPLALPQAYRSAVSLRAPFICATLVHCRRVYPLPQGVLVRYIGGLRSATAAQTDERVRLTGEVISGVLATKMLGGCQSSVHASLLLGLFGCCWACLPAAPCCLAAIRCLPPPDQPPPLPTCQPVPALLASLPACHPTQTFL
jgi:hypothetical protein